MTEGALVLEGGSLRSVFTAGVLDTLVEQGIELSYVNGVSAGTMAGMNYISKQRGRMLRINRGYLHDKRYMGLEGLIKNRSIFNFDFVFGELSDTLVPYDYDTFFASPQKFEVVTTRCRTGKPEFFSKEECPEILTAVRASSSIPMMSRMVKINHRSYLDGGISLPVAYERAFELGYEKVVLVLTRAKGYRKPPIGKLTRRAYERYFAPLPELLSALLEVPERYNRMQEEMEQLEAEGRIYVLRPEQPVLVSRFERNEKKLEALYAEGAEIAVRRMEELRTYLEK